MENKILNKKEQIELIIDRIRKFDKIITSLSNILDENLDIFGNIYDIGYQIIPIILGVSIDDFYVKTVGTDNCDVENDILYLVMNNFISKEEFFEKLEEFFGKLED